MNERLKKLYQSIILKHNKEPYHFEQATEAQHHIEAYNPLCGDRFKLYLSIQDEKIAQLHFHGYGCAISKASTSVLVEYLEHKSIQEALDLCKTFESVTASETMPLAIKVEAFEAFEAAKDFPGRLKCVRLAWEAMESFLRSEDYKIPV